MSLTPFRRLQRRSFRWILSMAAAGLLIAATAVSALVVPARQREVAGEALGSKALLTAKLLTPRMKDALRAGAELAERAGNDALADPDFLYFLLVGPQGKVAASLGRKGQRVPDVPPKMPSGSVTVIDEQRGELVAVQQIPDSDGARLFVAFSTAPLAAAAHGTRLSLLFVGANVLLAGVLAAFFYGEALGRSAARVQRTLREATPANAYPRTLTRGNELAQIEVWLGAMMKGSKRTFGTLQEVGNELESSARAILAAAHEQQSSGSEQSAGLEELTRSMENVATTAREVVSSCDQLVQTTTDMSRNVNEAQTALSSASDRMMEIVSHQDLVNERFGDLFERSQAIIKIVDIIDVVSDRLDLLALNAAIEACRAGAVGKGFTLVAHEMRRLAENVAGSTREIKDTIAEIQRSIQASSEASHQGTELINDGAREIERMAGSIIKVFNLIGTTSEVGGRIDVYARQQLSAMEQVATAMVEIGEAQNQNTSSAHDVTRSADELIRLAGALRDEIGFFTTRDAARAAAESSGSTMITEGRTMA